MYNITTRYIFPLYSSEIGPNDVDDGSAPSDECCCFPRLITRGVFSITMVIIISLHRAVRKRGEQYLETSVTSADCLKNEPIDALYSVMCVGLRDAEIDVEGKSVGLTSRAGEAMAGCSENIRVTKRCLSKSC